MKFLVKRNLTSTGGERDCPTRVYVVSFDTEWPYKVDNSLSTVSAILG